ncbi:CU044_5270 family protein [Streptomyces ferrugineus]|uniref:CU044_5270 family protein n=1 Tax=Streptomyces ferrugineus TaxID=1413221 RepID=A0A7M2SW86_9ACTN|nr:CU044_5270 family protein [Streptomyces ferrugineus]QOV40630.1 CU044_5270 family protein [Streptomyces ferrugineus]
MADELELLRRANPVPVDGPHYGDGPLDHHAERHLDRLLRERPPAPRRRTRPAWGLAATAVVVALVSALLLTGRTTAPAVAAPRPLVVRADSTPVPLKRLAERAEQAASADSPALRKGTHVQSWSLAMSDADPPVTLPRETIVRWNDDDSHTEIVVATDPRHPGRPVLTDEGGEPRLVDDGHVLTRRTHPPSWSDAPPESRPPHDSAALHDYLEETERAFLSDHSQPLSTAELLDATKTLLDHWTLGTRESAALARLLADAQGLRPVGQVTDRLGRRGQAYVYDGRGSRRMLILDPANGAVLGLEATFTRDDAEFGVRAGDVMEYSAWMR